MEEEKKARLREQLEAHHDWPSMYMYKFIVPTAGDKLVEVKRVFNEAVDFSTRESSGGKFVSLTVKEMMLNVDAIFDRYEKVGKIGGVISL